ncbi:MAG: patatin-like phospholipase family protein [Alphaproteobacteria bacterium]|nr:patatin-like phospholipase family protein [Alphaproteobacteria bacterium]
MENKKRVFTVLCIDGGGVRGVIPARILQEIEERTGKPIVELFDMIGGTSTGAIIGGCLLAPDPKNPSKPRFTAKETLSFYHNLAGKVFPEMRFKGIRKLSTGALYDPKPLEDGLKAHLGDLKMKDMLTSFLIPAADIKNFKPVWITHLKDQKDKSKEGWDSMLLRDAVRVATSAPTYFPARYVETTPNEETPNIKHRHALIDGGFFGGNAMQHLLAQAQKIAPPDAEIVVVHIGTGSPDNNMSPDEFNAFGPLGLVSPANGNILMSLVIKMSMRDCENDMRDEIGDRLFSFDDGVNPKNDPNSPSISMDDAREDNLKRLEKHAEKIIKDNNGEMDRLCSLLKHREFAEERHLESQDAIQKLTDKMAATNTVKGLMRLYMRIVNFSIGKEIPKPAPDDGEIKALVGKLTEHHKAEIDRIYRVMLDKKQHQNKILNAFKEAGENITDITKKIFVEPFKADPPPPANNDNKPPSSNTNNPPKRDGHKPGP